MEFLEVVDHIKAEEASVQRLFGSEGRGMRRKDQDPRYMARLAEVAGFVADVYEGRIAPHRLREALTTSDFPNLFGDIIDRQLLANYRETPASFRAYCNIATVPDFRQVKRFEVNGSEAVLAEVEQGGPYPESKLTDNKYNYAVAKYGRAIPFSWETMVDDDLQALQDVPARFGKAARRTEEKFATGLFVSSTGPNATFFSTGNKNIVNGAGLASGVNNPPLGIAGLQDAFTILSQQVDSDGEPIMIDAVHLVVPPALEVVANNILNATELRLYVQGGSADQQVITANWMQKKTKLSVNWYLPIVDTTHGNTAWYLFADPAGNRPAVEIGFLRGHTEPEVFMKQPNMVSVGGGAGTFQDGDFETDSIRYKVRHVLGGATMNVKMAVASTGASA